MLAVGPASASAVESVEAPNILDELDPYDPNIESILEEMDQNYILETGEDPLALSKTFFDDRNGCYRLTCPVYINIVKSTQTAYLYQDGELKYTWKVSTGTRWKPTPNFDRHPNGRVYDKYTSTRYPDGDYNGLGNMPYAVFIEGGFAIHGTTRGNWSKLGQRASHGCIRLHPDNAFIFNRMVRAAGIKNVWITVQ